VQETGDFELDGVTFPAAEVPVEFVSPIDADEALFPTGNLTDELEVPGVGRFEVTMINAGIPTIFLNAEDLGYDGTELQDAINGDPAALAIRDHPRPRRGAHGADQDPRRGRSAPAHAEGGHLCAPPGPTPPPAARHVGADDIDLNVRALSMGKLHHAMMGTAAVAIASAAAIPGTLVNLAAGGGPRDSVTFGHPSGTLKVGHHYDQFGQQLTGFQ
jgi:2-methylaconitate cis-trans-isomerase PrpF